MLDCLVGLRFLAEELIAWKTEHYEFIMRVGIPEFLEFYKLRCESTLGGGIDDEENLSLELTHRDGLTIRLLYSDIVD